MTPAAQRVLIIGNAGGGKSVLARKLAARRGLRYFEVDAMAWKPGWLWAPWAEYSAAHNAVIAQDRWVLDGLGWTESLAERFARATEVILIDMPIWMHFWLAAERQFQWATGKLERPVAGIAEPPTTEGLFKALWETDQKMMPVVRRLTDAAEQDGKKVTRIRSVDELKALTAAL